ncbi:MAG TPA: DUF4326 domain-containing protein [Devosia sp.]|nr:DUF4326 domain-containing protein [Devosia sp.]
MSVRPQRLRLSRHRGFDLQALSRELNGLPARRVTRPGKWGNPFDIGDLMKREGLDRQAAHDRAIELHRQWVEGGLDPALDPGFEPPSVAEMVAELGGHNLACWCRLDETCHAELLLRLANPGKDR